MTSRVPARRVAAFAAAPLLFAACVAHAHCGSVFCLVNTSWDAQGLWVDPGSRLDLRYEFIDQDTMKHGSGTEADDQHAAALGANRAIAAHADAPAMLPSPRHEEHPHEPLRTLNRVGSLSFDHSFDREFGVSLVVPWVARSHDALYAGGEREHVHATRFSKLGDVRVLGRWQFAHGETANWGLRFGAKLATGAIDVPGPHGDEFERNLQPGSGTTDAIVGVYANGKLGRGDGGWFAQATAQHALAQHDGFAPGDKLQLDGGFSHALGTRVLGQLQVNASWSGRDRGLEAAPEDTGARSVSVSPGLYVVLTPSAHLYVFVEQPLWRRLNGEQLVAHRAAALGFNWLF